MTMERQVDDVCSEIYAEVHRAMKLWPSMNSRHEAYAVILKELEGFWDECRRKEPDPEKMAVELRQVAAMCVRTIVDLELP